ncbi:MAG: hypothetical protein ABL914_01330 [Novosphingobium sp.]|uniref:hypothetical protein n=1 Tax=Novosphingobium sp. TaxID=1874826 RepID=UPI0032BB6EC0
MFNPPISAVFIAAAACALAGCISAPDAAQTPQQAFMARLGALCGKAFAGRVVASEPAGADADMAAKALVMHVRSCSKDRIEIPFHVGDDRSRTWVITRTAAGLRLQHDHRYQDGTSDAVTMYGGNSADAGSAGRQAFPVDAESVASFRANGLDRSITNTWVIEVDDPAASQARLSYELVRPAGPNARRFRVEFDLTETVPTPPAPWGW